MCAIAGSPTKEETDEMLETMEYRGPDAVGTASMDSYTVGMCRLTIIDTISEGLCPYYEKGFVLVFNGEVYNYRELRRELEALGYQFSTQSDTEVLMKSHIEWGVSMFDKLNWMGAFAILKKDGDLFLGRDLAGEKPLYYTMDETGFRFASEAKALGFTCNEFPAASFGIYTASHNELHIKTWWNFTPTERDITLNEAVAELDLLLEDAVKLRTRADVPYGLYFSGGIDSTLISTYHDFDRKYSYKNGDYQSEFLGNFKRILYHLDFPVSTFSPFGLWKLAQTANTDGTKVVLSGEGADELFGGYVRFVTNEFNRKASVEFPSYKGLFPFKEDPYWDEFNGNMRELLRMGDRMASAWGVENRCPFLDRRIIEFAFSLPKHLKVDGFETKIVLKALLKKRMPSYEFGEKHGLYVPVNEWLGFDSKFGKNEYREYQEKVWVEITEEITHEA